MIDLVDNYVVMVSDRYFCDKASTWVVSTLSWARPIHLRANLDQFIDQRPQFMPLNRPWLNIDSFHFRIIKVFVHSQSPVVRIPVDSLSMHLLP
jgi:hypothetical protein